MGALAPRGGRNELEEEQLREIGGWRENGRLVLRGDTYEEKMAQMRTQPVDELEASAVALEELLEACPEPHMQEVMLGSIQMFRDAQQDR